MNEGKFTAKLLKHLRQAMPEAVIFKHADKYTAGIPDFSITLDGITTWWEVKRYPRPLDKIQRETLRRLQYGFWIWWDAEEKRGSIYMVHDNGPDVKFHGNMPFWDLVLCTIAMCKRIRKISVFNQTEKE